MDLLLEMMIVWALGFWAGWRWHQVRMAQRILRDPRSLRRALDEIDRLNLEVKTLESPGGEPLRVERVGSQLYLYQADTDEFLAQGPDLESALEQMAQRFPNRSFRGHLEKEQADQLGIKAE